ncbi:hypothetical protein ATO6_20060 [Oceanicola sp. 22II-s10i]|nr:hypothetical protein ATO6_20060 [Oceanicola sp. 22II-s10i]
MIARPKVIARRAGGGRGSMAVRADPSDVGGVAVPDDIRSKNPDRRADPVLGHATGEGYAKRGINVM